MQEVNNVKSMMSSITVQGQFKYLGAHSSTNEWRNGTIHLQKENGRWYLTTALTSNPQRIYKQNEVHILKLNTVLYFVNRSVYMFIQEFAHLLLNTSCKIWKLVVNHLH